MGQTGFAIAAAARAMFRPSPGRGHTNDLPPTTKRTLKRAHSKAVRRLGKFLIHEAIEHDLEGDDSAPIQFVFQSPAYYCPACGARYGDSRDMEDCSREHGSMCFDQNFDWLEVEMTAAGV